MNFLNNLNPTSANVPESGIVALVNYARDKEGIIPLWVGEGDLPTPDFISDACCASLKRGETFYTWQRGIPQLRQSLADYHARLFNRPFESENFFVIGSGMQAIKIALEAVGGAGKEMIYFSPAWPNFKAAAEIAYVAPVSVPLKLEDTKWVLDMDAVRSAITPNTRAIFVNTPSNPTGWCASADEIKALIEISRQKNIWIIADEIYTQFHYSEGHAPSFMDYTDANDKVIYVNSFSKNWSMTGWRVGWIHAPEEIGQVLENLIQYSTSGVSHFMQQGAVAALNKGDDYLNSQIERAIKARDIFCDALLSTGRVKMAKPEGAFYAFFQIDGVGDTMSEAFKIVDEANVGLAPGSAFGEDGNDYFRACFHRRLEDVEEAASRLVNYINTR